MIVRNENTVLDFGNVEQKINSIRQSTVDRYCDYWYGIEPRNTEDKWRRWLFAFVSIRAQWKANKESYRMLAGENWQTKDELSKILHDSRIGLVPMRERAIWEFTQEVKKDKSVIEPELDDTWQTWRNRLVKKFFGIGLAKVSFAMEMCYPLYCGVVCLDTHILQMYGVDPRKGCGKALYEEMEAHWLKICLDKGYPSAITRHILWDKIQNKRNTRYWSHVLEAA